MLQLQCDFMALAAIQIWHGAFEYKLILRGSSLLKIKHVLFLHECLVTCFHVSDVSVHTNCFMVSCSAVMGPSLLLEQQLARLAALVNTSRMHLERQI
jgi:hypothetical protein